MQLDKHYRNGAWTVTFISSDPGLCLDRIATIFRKSGYEVTPYWPATKNTEIVLRVEPKDSPYEPISGSSEES